MGRGAARRGQIKLFCPRRPLRRGQKSFIWPRSAVTRPKKSRFDRGLLSTFSVSAYVILFPEYPQNVFFAGLGLSKSFFRHKIDFSRKMDHFWSFWVQKCFFVINQPYFCKSIKGGIAQNLHNIHGVTTLKIGMNYQNYFQISITHIFKFLIISEIHYAVLPVLQGCQFPENLIFSKKCY